MGPRKTIKRESTVASANGDPRTHSASLQEAPSSSGNTVLIDVESDTTMTEEAAPVEANGGLQVLGRGVKELVQAVQELRHLGCENLDLPLPKIVVVGDQSTGKSSLVEGMSEIQVPRNTGACTRCPLELNLIGSTAADSEWQCHIFLHMKYAYQGSLGSGRAYGKGATRARPLGPWSEQDPEDLHFAHITGKEHIKDALERAQLAILNPGTSFENFKPGNPLQSRDHQVKFSPNVIRLDINGPGLPNLSFFDLPGIISVSEVPDEAYLVELVKNLVKSYIKAEDCINLLALTMTHDVANSSAFGLIKHMKAEARTIGCLTKPDNLPKGESLDQWVHILGGQLYQLGFGYHVIKNNPSHLVNHAVAREEETAFFNECEPWSTTLSKYHNRFGTLLLQTALSHKLTAQIKTSLPRIKEQVREKAELIESQLAQLPMPLGHNVLGIVVGELKDFESQIQSHLNGGSGEYPFQKQWRLTARQFRQDLIDSCPTIMLPWPRVTLSNRRSLNSTPTPMTRNMAPISIESDEEDADHSIQSPPLPMPQSGIKRQSTSAQSSPEKYMRMTNGITRVAPSVRRFAGKTFLLTEVTNILQDHYDRLPNEIDPKATEAMIKLALAHWAAPLDHFVDRTRRLYEDMIFNLVQANYSKYSQTQYYEIMRAICESYFKTSFEEQRRLVKDLLSWELNNIETFNEEALNLAESEAMKNLLQKRWELRAKEYLDEQEAKSGKVSTGQGQVDKLSKITDAQLGPDIFNKELQVMSRVKGYYEVASNRFVDYVCASFRCKVFAQCRNRIVEEMRRQFGLNEAGAEERLAQLLAANPEHERRRAQLQKDLDTLSKAQQRLEAIDGNEY